MSRDELKHLVIRHTVAAVLLGMQGAEVLKASMVDGYELGEIIIAILRIKARGGDPDCEAVIAYLEEDADFAAEYVRPIFAPFLMTLVTEYVDRELRAMACARMVVLAPLHQALVAEAEVALLRAQRVGKMLRGDSDA